MIDYEKLKIAHELNKKNTRYTIMINLYPHRDLCFYALYDLSKAEQIDCKDIDDLIAKLKELTRPEPKYSDGQEVWIMYFNYKTQSNEIQKFKTDAHRYVNGVHQYFLVGNGIYLTCRDESEIYHSEQAMIDAQIQYWRYKKNSLLTSSCAVCLQDWGDCTCLKSGNTLTGCIHDSDTLENNQDFSFCRNSIGGGKYYFCHKTNDIYCQCGNPADFPHKCRCKKCGEYFK